MEGGPISIYWEHSPYPFVHFNDWNKQGVPLRKAIRKKLIELAVERGLLPKDALRLSAKVGHEIDEDVLLLPLEEAWGKGRAFRPEVVEYIRAQPLIVPPELAALVRGEAVDLSQRYNESYQRVLRKEAVAWREFLAGERDEPPYPYAIQIQTHVDLEAYLQLVVSSPLFLRELRHVRERLRNELRREAEEKRIKALEEDHQITLEWSPLRKFRFDEGHNYEAKVRGKAGNRKFRATFENVFDVGLIIRTPGGTVYRHQDGTWRWMRDDRPLGDPELEAFLEAAWHRMPPELRFMLM